MHFEGEFQVPGEATDVLRRFADVPRMAKCMPGAVLEPQAEDGSWPGAMVVTFGPKKINFRGKATCAFDDQALTGTVTGRGTADMRAARIGVKVSFALADVPDVVPPRTTVKIVSDAELGGVLADFAKTGGIAVANVIMADFARRASEEFSRDAPADPAADAPIDPAAGAPPTNKADGSPAAAGRGEARTSGSAAAREAAGEEAPRPTVAAGGPGVAGPVSAAEAAVRSPPPAAPMSEPAAPLKAGFLFRVVVKAYLLRFLRALGLAR
jgi:uncharacterized protein